MVGVTTQIRDARPSRSRHMMIDIDHGCDLLLRAKPDPTGDAADRGEDRFAVVF